MIEALGLEEYPIAALLALAGAVLGLIFGAAAQISRFCLRRALAGDPSERADAAGVWAAALLTALLGVQAAIAAGLIDLSATRFLAASLPLGALVIGGSLFGAGMVITRGCPSRLLVLASGGNLRALIVFLAFSAVAYATLRGVFAPGAVWLREALAVPSGGGALDARLGLGGAGLAVAGALALALAALVWRSGARGRDVALGAVIGLVILGGWLVTGMVLFDEFDPKPAESLAFTSGGAESLFYFMAATALEPSFGLGAMLGVAAGAHLSARLRGELRLESFSDPRQTGRYLIGGAMMGVGGVLAGGCTVGAGLTGVSTLGLAPIIALAAIIAGAVLASRLQSAPMARALGLSPAE